MNGLLFIEGFRLTFALQKLYSEQSMTLLFDAVEAKKFDSRVVERNIQRGHISVEDYKKQVEVLQDDAENSLIVSLDDLQKQGK